MWAILFSWTEIFTAKYFCNLVTALGLWLKLMTWICGSLQWQRVHVDHGPGILVYPGGRDQNPSFIPVGCD
jgi:hypothetical protein